METVAGPRQIEPGTKLDDKYRIEQLLAVGGMGAVYLGTHIPLRKRVAIKVLNPQVSSAPMIERFRREAITASQIGHEGIAQVTDFGTSIAGEPFLVMEYLEGESLAARLATSGPLPIEVACELGCAILAPLAAAHDAGIVHRDLKPDNVFLVRQSRGEAVKLLDFGISRAPGLEGEFRLTKTGLVLGTPYYMSPEQARGDNEVGTAADIYAFGVILYEMLIGRVPIDGDNYNQLMFHVLTGAYRLPRTERPEIPDELEQIILQAMALEPERRPASAVELEQRLLAFCRPTFRDHQIERLTSSSSGLSFLGMTGAQLPPGHPLLPTEPDVSRARREEPDVSRARREEPAMRAPVAAAAASAMDIPQPPSASASEAERAPAPRRRGLWIAGAAVVLCSVLAGVLLAASRGGDERDTRTAGGGEGSSGSAVAEIARSSGDSAGSAATAAPVAPVVAEGSGDPKQVSEVSAKQEVPEITLRFAVEPATAVIEVDGKPVTDRRLTVPKDGALHKVRITAPGYTSHQDEVRFDESQRLIVQLRRLPRAGRPQQPTRGKDAKDGKDARGKDAKGKDAKDGKPDRIEIQSPYGP